MGVLTQRDLYSIICGGVWHEIDENKSPLNRIFKFHPPGTISDRNAPGIYQERLIASDGSQKVIRSGDSFTMGPGLTIQLGDDERYDMGFENGVYSIMVWIDKSAKRRTFKNTH